MCVCLCIMYVRACMVGIKKKFPSSIRTKGARLKKKTGGERAMNGANRSVRIPVSF